MSHTELFVVVKTRGILDILVGENKKDDPTTTRYVNVG